MMAAKIAKSQGLEFKEPRDEELYLPTVRQIKNGLMSGLLNTLNMQTKYGYGNYDDSDYRMTFIPISILAEIVN